MRRTIIIQHETTKVIEIDPSDPTTVRSNVEQKQKEGLDRRKKKPIEKGITLDKKDLNS